MRFLTLPFIALSTLCAAQTLQTQVQAIAQQRGLTGMSVVTACDGLVTNVVHTGQRNIAQGLPVNDSTRFRIASISKLVSAIGLMKLHELGAFQLDDDVSTALGFSLRNPAFPNTPITYRMLLTHRSSLQDGTGYANFLNATYATTPPPPIAQLLQPGGTWYTSNLWRTEAPGSFYTYSNLNFGVVGTLIEAHSGQRFDVYMRDSVLLPLGINGSFNIQDLDDIAQLSVLYRNSSPQADNFNGVMPAPPNLSGYVNGSNGLYFGPQGGLRCSALELMRVATMLLQQGTISGTTVLQPATVQAMLNNEWTWNGSNGDNYYGLFRSWGLGVHRITAQTGGDIVLPGLPMFGHAGEAYGLISDLYFDPVSGFSVVFISNGYTAGNSYVFGNTSAFYLPEEEVYAAMVGTAYADCITTGALEPGTIGADLNASGGVVQWTGAADLHYTVHDMLGKTLASGVLSSGGRWTNIVAGVVVFSGTDKNGRHTLLRLP